MTAVLRRLQEERVVTDRAYSSYPTICGINSPETSVNRMSRPLYRYVSFLWSMPSKASIVACKS